MYEEILGCLFHGSVNRPMKQVFFEADKFEEQLHQVLEPFRHQRLMLVAGKSFLLLPIRVVIERVAYMLEIEIIRFSGFSPNPSYEEVMSGIHSFHQQRCRGILAVGGGSAIDVAKCIKVFSINSLETAEILLMAIPTTAGTGSESTQFAVIYKNGEKCSVDDMAALPQYVLLDAANLLSVPVLIKRSAAADALSHAVESFWSLRASDKSKELSAKAIQIILENMEAYWDKTGLKKNSLFGTEVVQTQDSIENFAEKISSGKKAQRTKDFMICARIESLILEQGMEDALERAKTYVNAGADAIMIHSRKKNPDEVFEFVMLFRRMDQYTPIVVVPTSFNTVTEDEFKKCGVNVVIYANQLMRATVPAIQKAAVTILENHRAKECDEFLMPFSDIIRLIPDEV